MHFLQEYANYIGLVGVVIILVAYFMLQIERISAHGVRYSLVNLIGSLLILVSLIYHFNLASFVIEIAWLCISIYGLHRSLKKRRQQVCP